jgi:hypothetical protein
MFVRAVRFTGVTEDRVTTLIAQIEAADGAPAGVNTTGLQLLFDDAQQTAVVLQHFPTAQDMEEGAKVFAAMDAGETPGTRVSVDMCELRLDVTAPDRTVCVRPRARSVPGRGCPSGCGAACSRGEGML